MMGKTTGIEKTVKCTAVISTAFTIAKFGADDDTLDLAAAATDKLVAVFQHITSAVGERVRVMLTGISDVKLGGNVTRGDFVTSDANAKGVTCAPATGVNNSYVGMALASGALNDIIPVRLMPGIMQGA